MYKVTSNSNIKCKGCGSAHIANKTLCLCDYCNYRRLHNGKSRYEVILDKKKLKDKLNPPKQSSIKQKKKTPTGERDIFLEIWQEEIHECKNCGDKLGDIPKVFMFSHKKPKSTHSELRLVKTNIELSCWDCHYAHEFMGEEAFKKRKDLYRK